jgi:hypothetical protein
VRRERRKSRLLSVLLLALTSLIIWGVTELLTRVCRLAAKIHVQLGQACLRRVWRRASADQLPRACPLKDWHSIHHTSVGTGRK